MNANLTIVLVGDSTVATYPAGSVLQGWGKWIGRYLRAEVINLAVCGASTKTFLTMPQWQQALAAKADYLLIQFGHNDSHASDRPESTSADGDYITNLRQMIAQARAAGSTPILVTPMHRRSFEADGSPTQELLPYASAMQRVAQELNVPLIDLYRRSGEVYASLGDEQSANLTGPGDRTHFTTSGAQLMAALVAAEVTRLGEERLAGAVAS